MLDRTAEQFDVQPSRLVADAGYGSAEMLGWLVDERGIEPHVKVFDKSERSDVTQDGAIIYRAGKLACDACALKPKCCPNVPARKIARSLYEAARDKARAIAKTDAYAVSPRERKRVEMLFAHLKRILKLDRLLLRGPNGAKDEFLLTATAQNLRKLAKLIPLPPPMFAA
jgi:hypothetical protein